MPDDATASPPPSGESPGETAEETLISVAGLGVTLGGKQVLTGIDLTLRRGEVVTLIGPNGAGKSTLVRVILGLLAPTRGTLRRKPGLKLGYLPQSFAVDPILPLTVDRFLALPHSSPPDSRRAVLAEVGAAGLSGRNLDELSGGEFRRVLLARALLREPDLLVLDEPAQGVDFGGQIALYELIGGLRGRRGMGVLMVSHDLHLVMAATDRVICLNSHVCCSGAPEAVSRNPEYISLFGPLARGLAVYTHDHDHAHGLHGEVIPTDGVHPRTPRGGGA
jgi:zinc transport system ATP-binding protein